MRHLVNKDVSNDQKAYFLHKLTKYYWHVDADSALFFSRKGIALPMDDVSPANQGRLYFGHGFTHTMHGNTDSVFYYMQMAEQIFQNNNNEFMAYRVVEQMGCIYREIGNFEEAAAELDRAEKYFRRNLDAGQINSVLINKGSLYYDQNRYSKALEYYMEAASYDTVLSDPASTAMTNLGIGLVYMGLGDLFKHLNNAKANQYYETSLNYYDKSCNLFQDIGHITGVCYCKMNQIANYIALDDMPRALSAFQDSETCLQLSDTRIKSTLLIRYADILKHQKEFDQALMALDEVEEMKDQLVIPHVFYYGRFLRAEILMALGRKQEAYELADSTLEWFLKNRQFAYAYPVEKEITKWHHLDHDYKKAFGRQQSANTLHDNLFEIAMHEIYDEVALRFENQLLSSRIDLMEAEAEASVIGMRNRNLLILFAALVLILLLMLLLWYKKQASYKNQLLVSQTRQLEQENENKKNQLEKINLENKLKEEEMELIQLEAEMREQEMVFNSLRQANLLMLNQSIKEKMGPFQYRFTRKKDQEAFSKELEALCRDASRDPLSDFEKMFTQMHNGFYEKLVEMNNSFSRSELQMCALLRMNLPSKEIANMLSLSVSRVDQTRHQIRKKLNLDPNVSLTSHLILF